MSQKPVGTKGKQCDHLCYGDPGPGAEAGAPLPPALRWDRAPGRACAPGMPGGKDLRLHPALGTKSSGGRGGEGEG